MIFDPIGAVSSSEFYGKVSRQSLGRTLLYLCFLGAVFSLVATLALKVKVGPSIDDTFDWLAKSVPPMTYAGGKLTSTASAPVRLANPKLPEIAVLIDTTRTAPVSPQELDQAKVMAYVTSTAFYVRHNDGKVEVWDLSRSAGDGKPLQVDAGFFRSANMILDRVLYPVAFVVILLVFVAWKSLASLLFSLIALMINAIARAELPYPALLNMSVYAQTLVIALQALSLFLPFSIPGGSAISLALTSLYLWLAVKRSSPPQQPA